MSMDRGHAALEAFVETRGVKGAYAVGYDGFLLALIDAGAADAEGVAAAAAVAAVTSERVGQGLQLGDLKWILLEFKHGKMVIARLGSGIAVVVGTKHLAFGEVLRTAQALAQAPAQGI